LFELFAFAGGTAFPFIEFFLLHLKGMFANDAGLGYFPLHLIAFALGRALHFATLLCNISRSLAFSDLFLSLSGSEGLLVRGDNLCLHLFSLGGLLR
jgi:hypothetical protein